MDQYEFIFDFSKHSEKMYKSYNFEFFGIQMASESLAVLL